MATTIKNNDDEKRTAFANNESTFSCISKGKMLQFIVILLFFSFHFLCMEFYA